MFKLFQKRGIQLTAIATVAGLIGVVVGIMVIPSVAQNIMGEDEECLVYVAENVDTDASNTASDLITTEDNDDGNENESDESCGLLDDAAFTLDEMIQMAEAEVGGTVINIELENENGGLVFGATTTSGLEVEFDADTGELLEIERAD